MPSELLHLLTRDRLRDLAGFRAYRDGHVYHERGQVYGLNEKGHSVSAKVLGLYEYQVKLWTEGDTLRYLCSCPAGNAETLCKHGVAVGLTLLGGHSSSSAPVGSEEPENREDPLKILTNHLALQERSTLISLIVDLARENPSILNRLLFRTTQYRNAPRDRNRFQQYIDRTLGHPPDSDAYAGGLRQTFSALEEIQDEAAVALDLTEYTLEKVQEDMTGLNSAPTGLQDTLDGLQRLHLRLCRVARPEPAGLAGRLFEWRLNPRWDLFRDALATYSEILGEEGVNAYIALAREAWSAEPELKPGDREPERFGRRFRLAYILEALARQTGDVDAIAEIRKKELSQPSGFLSMAELYKEYGKDEQALAWAEQGHRAFPGRVDPRLRDFLAREYRLAGRDEDAEKLLRE